MRYSIQQIKFDFISAIRDIDDEAGKWAGILADCPPEEALRCLGRDPGECIFIAKPAVSDRAAEMVLEFMVRRLGVYHLAFERKGHWAMIFRDELTPNILVRVAAEGHHPQT